MTNIPELTDDEATVLRFVMMAHDSGSLPDPTLIDDMMQGRPTKAGRANLAAYDAKQRAKIRVESMRECEAEARCVFFECNMDDENGVNMAIAAIRALIAKEQSQ